MKKNHKEIERQLKERYNEFPVPVTKSAKAAHQLCVKSEAGVKLYFINVYVYVYSLPDVPDVPHTGYTAECQFHNSKGFTFDVSLHNDWQTLDEMEEFFKQVYQSLPIVPYEE